MSILYSMTMSKNWFFYILFSKFSSIYLRIAKRIRLIIAKRITNKIDTATIVISVLLNHPYSIELFLFLCSITRRIIVWTLGTVTCPKLNQIKNINIEFNWKNLSKKKEFIFLISLPGIFDEQLHIGQNLRRCRYRIINKWYDRIRHRYRYKT